MTSIPISSLAKEESSIAALAAATRRHALLFADYFTQYAKVRIGYRCDFVVSLLTSFGSRIFQIALVVVPLEKAPHPGGGRFEEFQCLYGITRILYTCEYVIRQTLFDFV